MTSTDDNPWDFGSEGGYQPSQGPAERLGLTRIGPYEIEGEVARGGMGVVYRGRDVRLARPVAIKLLLAPGAGGLADRRVRRFAREAETLAALNHPGVLAVYDFGTLPDRKVPYLITEWLEGETLADRLRHEGTLPIAESLDLAETISRAVAYVHERGVLHRDLKPSNIVLAPRGPVVIDFGLAKRQDPEQSRLTQTGAMAGTTGYAAPEQFRDASSVDERADVYGLGATLYALLTGAPPGGHDEGGHLARLAASATGKFPLASELRAGIPGAVDALLARALAFDPEERISDAGALADALAALPAARSGLRSTLVIAIAGAVLTLGILAGGLASLGEGSPEPSVSPSESLPLGSREPASPPSPLGSPTADAGALEAALRDLIRVERDLEAAPIEAQALARLYQRGELATNAILEVAQTSAARWPAIRHLVTAGRFQEAKPLLDELARDPAFRARANLELAWIALTGSPKEVALRALGNAADVAGEGRDSDEIFARRLATILYRVQSLPVDRAAVRVYQNELRALLGEDIQTPWRQRTVWATCVFTAFFAPPRHQAAISAAWNDPGRTGPRLVLPKHSALVVWLLVIASGEQAVLSDDFTEVFDAHAPRIRAPAFHRAVAMDHAAAGSMGGLERALSRLERVSPGVLLRIRRACQGAAEGRGGRVLGNLRAASFSSAKRARLSWLRVRTEPRESRFGVWLQIPPETQRWSVRLVGAEVDFDLRLRRDGPPSSATGWQRSSLSMGRNEHVEGKGGGVYFLQIERSTPWPIPLELALELETCGPGDTLSVPADPWDLPIPAVSAPGVREAFLASRRHFAGGRIDQALAALDPHLDREPQTLFVRWSTLDLAARWETLNAEVREIATEPGPRGRLANWLEGRSYAFLSKLPEADRSLSRLTRSAPELIEAWALLAVVRVGQGKIEEAKETVAEARRRFPVAPALELLELAVAGRARREAFASRFRELQEHAQARRLVLGCLFFQRRGADTLVLLQGLPDDLKREPREVLSRVFANLSLGNRAEAIRLLKSVEEASLSPSLRAQFAGSLRELR